MFILQKQSNISKARLGELNTRHGKIRTPFFMPVATQGAVKHITTEEIKKIGADILLANTYHLMLRPGEKLVKRAGGLNKFMDWPKPILTDSGGFQVFSLAGTKRKGGENLVQLTPQGVRFKSYIDGKAYYLTPEKALKIQIDLGVDIAVCLDQCVALPARAEEMQKAVALTSAWAAKTWSYYKKIKAEKPLLFCVVQGGLDKELRLKSLHDLMAIDFSARGGPVSGWDGYNIGGLSVGESELEMYKVLDYLVPALPENKPRYLMGVGYPDNIVEAVRRGVDMFDCVIPTREGRHGRLFLWNKIANHKPLITNFCKQYQIANITNAKFKNDLSAINEKSKLPELRNLTKAYLHYLFSVKEPLGQRLASLNNLEFYLDLMEKIRYHINFDKL